MTITMNDDQVVSVAQVQELVKLPPGAQFEAKSQEEAYSWIDRALDKFRYRRASKKNRGVIKRYVMMMTGYSETQVDRLIRRKRDTGRVRPRTRTQPTFPRVYTPNDIALLAEVDAAEEYRNGRAVVKTLRDMYRLYEDQRFVRLQNLSVSRLYDLRKTRQYTSHTLTYTKTKPTAVAIGTRKKPQPLGQPGFLRVDSVHQGDLDKEKGVYHINLVDEVTQWEIVACVEGISEYFLAPVLEAALREFPFRILNFHSDNGSEYINQVVARLLGKLLIEQTKSRARKSNDNALVEGKNGSVIRPHLGYVHIPRKCAPAINVFYRDHFNPYLNFHRQCAFPERKVDANGKMIITYPSHMTPCEKLLSLPDADRYLRGNISIASLQAEQMRMSHLRAAQAMQEVKGRLFTQIHNRMIK